MSFKVTRRITPEMRDTEFESKLKKLLREKGEKLPMCFQCGVCSGSCPAVFAMDYTPRQLMELIKLGVKDEVMNSSTIWICAACYMCSVRCPQGVDLKQIMETLKEIAIADPKYAREEKRLYETFVDIVRKNGRMNEIGLYMKMMPPSALAGNLGFGLSLFKKNKIKLTPNRVENLGQIATIYQKTLSKEAKKE